MSCNLDNLTVMVNWLVRQKLDRNWNTEYFRKATRILPYSRIYFPVSGYGTVEHKGRIYKLVPGRMEANHKLCMDCHDGGKKGPGKKAPCTQCHLK